MTLYIQEAIQKNATDIYIDQGIIFFRVGRSLVKTQHAVQEFGTIPAFCERKSRHHIRLLSQDLSAKGLQYPDEVSSILRSRRGLVLCMGTASSGKTTLILHLLKNHPTARVAAYNTHVKASSPYRICQHHLWCAIDENPDVEVLTIRSEESAFHALMNASNRLVCANIKAKGIEDGLNKLMLYLHSYPKEYVLNLLSAYTNCLVSTALVTSLTGNIQPLIGIAQMSKCKKTIRSGIMCLIKIHNCISVNI